MRYVDIRSDGRQVAGQFFASPASQPSGLGLLFAHGLSSNQAGYVARAKTAAAALNGVCLTFDLGGHGDSEGRQESLAPNDHLADMQAAYDTLAGRPDVDQTRIGVCGSSYGGYLAAFLTSCRKVQRLLLRAPALYDDHVFRVPWAQPRRSSPKANAGALRRALREFDGKVLILESENDQVLPSGVIDWYVDAYPGAQREILPGAGHALSNEYERQRFVDVILRFFDGI
jgi:pimeloyl-ACP methyl ester carboxylesterase